MFSILDDITPLMSYRYLSIVTIYPEPEWPYNIAPYFLVLSLIAGFGYMQWLVSRRPGALLLGATMLVGSRTAQADDVD